MSIHSHKSPKWASLGVWSWF